MNLLSNNTFNSVFKCSNFFCVVFLILLQTIIPNLHSQTPAIGPWLPNNTSTTQHDLGVGTSSPRGKQEIIYCPKKDPQDGLIVTAKDCNPNLGTVKGEGNWQISDPNNPTIFPVPALTLSPFIQTLPSVFSSGITKNNLLWVRTEDFGAGGGMNSNGAYNFKTHFIVNSDGRVGVNTMNPRAQFDVVQPNNALLNNTPTAIFSKRSFGVPSLPLLVGSGLMANAFRTSQMLFFNRLGNNAYNNIIEDGDQAIIFSDGGNTDGSNVNGTFVIAPWASSLSGNVSSIGGIRIDRDGNLDVHNAIRCRSLKVRPKWWADSVFSANYNLMSLDSLNSYIVANKHLPYFPSESEVNENGIEIAEMQAIQTKSLEEIYLQLIQLNAIVKKQQEIINTLIQNK